MGVTSIAPHYRFGRVRLPDGNDEAHLASQHLVREVTKYPGGRYDDCVMMHWIMEWNLPLLAPPIVGDSFLETPEFVKRRAS